MKKVFLFLCVTLLVISCQSKSDTDVDKVDVMMTPRPPEGGIMPLKLLSAGPAKARVRYMRIGQEINIQKYYGKTDSLGIHTTDMSYLQPCINNFIIATVDDRGEILSLMCGDRHPVIVVPDEYLK